MPPEPADSSPIARPRVLIDCDPGHDDVVAIIVAAAYADLLGITTVAGNAPLERTTYNACVTREWLARSTRRRTISSTPIPSNSMTKRMPPIQTTSEKRRPPANS